MLTNLLKGALLSVILCFLFFGAESQSIRPYSQVFSQDLKGTTAIFGNTSMNIVDLGSPNLTKMNETGNASNGQGGLGYSQYGNDAENMQPAMIDALNPNLSVFATGSTWYYNNGGVDLGTAWRTLVAPGSPWLSAAGSFGFGTTQNTTLSTGRTTNYFVKTVSVAAPSQYTTFDFSLTYRDGAVVYVNGSEVYRVNMGSGTISYSSLAAASQSATVAFSIPSTYFIAGNNTIAVELHPRAASSTKGLFDMSLGAIAYNPSNATSSDLSLPAGTNTIKFARLYWGGRIDNSTVAAGSADTLLKIKLRKGSSGAYSSFIAPATSHDQYAVTATDIFYQSYVDITGFIQSNGAGTYTVADVPETAGAISGGGEYGGWCIVIVYENPSLLYNSVRIYDGFGQVFNSGTPVTQTVTLTGLNVPNNPLSSTDASLSTMAWEGDANLGASLTSPDGDYLKINGNTVSNAVNPAANFWNGSISANGAFVTTKNPNYSNQMGMDIDQMYVGTGYGILPNATSATFVFGTEADQYFPSVFAFAIRLKDPVISLNKTVADANGDDALQSNEVITYTLSGTNAGPGAAYNTVLIDSLPTNATYVVNSLKINNAPGITVPTAQTDASDADFAFKATNGTRDYVKFFIGTGASSGTGGTMDGGTSYSVSFKMQAPLIPGSISNTATVTTSNGAGAPFSATSTAIIAPAAGPVSVKLLLLTAVLKDGRTSLVSWTTENELNNHQFDVERSDDGVHFSYRGSVAGSGTSSTEHNYVFNDDLANTGTIVYYRLKIIDLEGRYAYSKIVALHLKGSSTRFSVYPNPFESALKVYVSTPADAVASFRLFSADGKEVMNRPVSLQKGDNVVELDNLEYVQSGTYFLEVNTGADKYVEKVIRK